MVHIPFPRLDLNGHPDLTRWRANNSKASGDWKILKEFLADHSRLIQGIHPIPKCWYTELPQGDHYALDVEHFRPKNQARPLTKKQVAKLEKRTGIVFLQNLIGGNYNWLEFDYRNYRLTTATPNRGGAKHVYFPVVHGTNRLNNGEFPWLQKEYNFCLDPADPHDATLLMVKPDGKIEPRTPKTLLTAADFVNLPQSWHNDGFNYVRAWMTIQLYRLEEKIFEQGRKVVYDKINELMERLLLCFDTNADPRLTNGFIKDITECILPSAPFALSARCALEAYVPPPGIDVNSSYAISQIPRQILDKVINNTNAKVCSWDNP